MPQTTKEELLIKKPEHYSWRNLRTNLLTIIENKDFDLELKAKKLKDLLETLTRLLAPRYSFHLGGQKMLHDVTVFLEKLDKRGGGSLRLGLIENKDRQRAGSIGLFYRKGKGVRILVSDVLKKMYPQLFSTLNER